MPLAKDIVERVRETFPLSDAAAALELLDLAALSGRVARCVVFVSHGNLEALGNLIDGAREDNRDVIVAAEYDHASRRIRDLTSSFLIDTPLKMWVAELANLLATREYFLSSIQAVPVSLHRSNYTSDLGEGIATFEGDLGQLRITKKTGQWLLVADQRDLGIYGLDGAFTDAGAFRNKVSGYILSKRRPRK